MLKISRLPLVNGEIVQKYSINSFGWRENILSNCYRFMKIKPKLVDIELVATSLKYLSRYLGNQDQEVFKVEICVVSTIFMYSCATQLIVCKKRPFSYLEISYLTRSGSGTLISFMFSTILLGSTNVFILTTL